MAKRKRRGFTLIELLVVVAVIAILMAILMPALSRAREYGKRATCLGNLKTLSLAWIMYADANDDKLVNGDTGEHSSVHRNEPQWIVNDTRASTIEAQQKCLMGGALWPYVRNLGAFKCPTTPRINWSGESQQITNTARSYSVVDSMNVRRVSLDDSSLLAFKRRMDIPQPATMTVFIDDGGYGYHVLGGWGIWLRRWQWNDPPPVVHADGTQWAFADGHAEYHKWEEKNTLDWALQGRSNGGGFPGCVDLVWTGKALWGNAGTRWYYANMP